MPPQITFHPRVKCCISPEVCVDEMDHVESRHNSKHYESQDEGNENPRIIISKILIVCRRKCERTRRNNAFYAQVRMSVRECLRKIVRI